MADCNVLVDGEINDQGDNAELKQNDLPEHQLLHGEDESKSEQDTKCGLACCTPNWLQLCASKKSYVAAYSGLGIFEASVNSYYTGTISTMEKRFKLPSTATGIISSGWDAGGVIASLLTAYIGHNVGHKTRWVATGLLLMSFGCFIHYLPHTIYGPGNLILNTADDTISDNLCNKTSSESEESCSLNSEATVTFLILLSSHLLLGIGSSAYYTLGAAYLDDNLRKNKFPFTLGLISAIYYLGPSLGLVMASYNLNTFINPNYTPNFTDEDPRWIGAWHIGWIHLGFFGLILAFLMALFPRILPREAKRRNKVPDIQEDQPEEMTSFEDFKDTLSRLSKNSVLILNTISFTLYIFGTSGFWIFLPKYIEAQFRKSASEANIITGAVGLFCTSFGSVAGGMIISKFKPSSKFLASWCVITETLEMLSFICYAYLGCFKEDFHGNLNTSGRWNLEAECNKLCGCSSTMEYSPVCSMDQTMTFFSSCHAGCMTSNLVNNTEVYNNCSCINGSGGATEGVCPSDCSADFITFTILLFAVELIASTGRPANTLIQFRAVEPRDKATMLALSEVLMSGLGWVPGPVFFGIILDASCLIWEVSCGEKGNCWFYDGQKMRFLLNYTAAGFVFLAILLDIGVLLKIGTLQMYDRNENDKQEDGQRSCQSDYDHNRFVCQMDLRMLRLKDEHMDDLDE